MALSVNNAFKTGLLSLTRSCLKRLLIKTLERIMDLSFYNGAFDVFPFKFPTRQISFERRLVNFLLTFNIKTGVTDFLQP